MTQITQKEIQKIQKEFLTLIARITQKEIQKIQKETYHEGHEEHEVNKEVEERHRGTQAQSKKDAERNTENTERVLPRRTRRE